MVLQGPDMPKTGRETDWDGGSGGAGVLNLFWTCYSFQ